MKEFTLKKPKMAWLIALSGSKAGHKFLLEEPLLRIGRASENQLIPVVEEADLVSAYHLQITNEGSSFRVQDLDSSHGTYLNEELIVTAILKPGDVLSLGLRGPRFRFMSGLAPLPGKASKMHHKDEDALNEAVNRAREIRKSGGGDTVVIMRELLMGSISRSRRKLKSAVAVLLIALFCASGYLLVSVQKLETKKSDLDHNILSIEEALIQITDSNEFDAAIQRLERCVKRARRVEQNIIYQYGVISEDEFVMSEIKKIMTAFGDPEYSIPPTFKERVETYITVLQETNRLGMQEALINSRSDLNLIRELLKKKNLPPDLAYMVIIESSFQYGALSSAGAAGPWQFVPGTARAYGLQVNADLDERYDVDKSTVAASRYIRHLILEFGSGDGVMLALAAYNLGPTRVKRAIRKVMDPIRQRDFWYLYRLRALPKETREYVPKIIAAIIIGRNPARYGFVTDAQSG